MKKLITVFFFATIISCNNNSQSLSGEWRSDKGTYMTISEENNKYFVKIGGSDYMGKFEEDKIKIESQLGDIQYSREKDRLYFAGEEFARKEFLEAKAKRVQADKISFNSVWKKVPHDGGQYLGDFLVIELSESGRFIITERNSLFDVSEFRSINYENGVISGIYYFAVDNEHTVNFEIKKSDENTLVYKDENSEEKFTRYVETDNFTGKWKGYYLSYGSQGEVEEKEPTFTFTITKEAGKYRVLVESLTSSKPDNYYGSLRGGKIIVDGNAKDFYKYQIPIIELSTNGNLMYKDGGGDIRLKKIQ